MPYLIVPTATNAKRIARCWHYQHLAHKAGSNGNNNTTKGRVSNDSAFLISAIYSEF